MVEGTRELSATGNTWKVFSRGDLIIKRALESLPHNYPYSAQHDAGHRAGSQWFTELANLLLLLLSAWKVPAFRKPLSCSFHQVRWQLVTGQSTFPPIWGLWQLRNYRNTYLNLTVQLNHPEQFSKFSDYYIQEYANPTTKPILVHCSLLICSCARTFGGLPFLRQLSDLCHLQDFKAKWK